MKVIPLEQADPSLSEIAELAKKGAVILTRNGKPLAAIRDLSGSDWEAVSLANNPQFSSLIEESRRSYREQGGTGLDELGRQLGLKPSARKRRPKQKRER